MKFIKFLSLLSVLILFGQINCAAKLDGEVKAVTDQQVSKVNDDLKKYVYPVIDDYINPFLDDAELYFENLIDAVKFLLIDRGLENDEFVKNAVLDYGCKLLEKYETQFMTCVYHRNAEILSFIRMYKEKNKFLEKVLAKYYRFNMKKSLINMSIYCK